MKLIFFFFGNSNNYFRYTEYIDDELVRHARDAKAGGVPSPAHRIRVFMNLKFKKGSGEWSDPRYEVIYLKRKNNERH